jgi:C2H2-type zinc finger
MEELLLTQNEYQELIAYSPTKDDLFEIQHDNYCDIEYLDEFKETAQSTETTLNYILANVGFYECNHAGSCGMKFHSEEELVTHKREFHDIFIHPVKVKDKVKRKTTGFICDMCGKRKKNRKEIMNHFQHTHKIKPKGEKCNLCDLYFKTILGLIMHATKKHKDLLSKNCTQCGKTFESFEQMFRHIKLTHHNKMAFNGNHFISLALSDESKKLLKLRRAVGNIVFKKRKLGNFLSFISFISQKLDGSIRYKMVNGCG